MTNTDSIPRLNTTSSLICLHHIRIQVLIKGHDAAEDKYDRECKNDHEAGPHHTGDGCVLLLVVVGVAPVWEVPIASTGEQHPASEAQEERGCDHGDDGEDPLGDELKYSIRYMYHVIFQMRRSVTVVSSLTTFASYFTGTSIYQYTLSYFSNFYFIGM